MASTADASGQPRPIRRLHETLINRIAAGEVIQRPSSALKELLENALDAGSTAIQVVVKDGGLKLLQIRDNGSGIRKDDMPLLAERFTTSKLSEFSDLATLSSYGFRGEALASISHVAHLNVVTKTKTDTCAWKAHYADGVLVPAKPGQTAEPKPCAGTDGTIITVEDLFHNAPIRLSALRNASEEYNQILSVVAKYAIRLPHVSFAVKKSGGTHPDLLTPGGATTRDIIERIYGLPTAKSLLSANADCTKPKWAADLLVSSPSHTAKKFEFLLFINHRLVDCAPMKRAFEAVYANILPKGTHPFVYCSIEMDTTRLDVNVHPTKREVRFLDEEDIIDEIAKAIGKALSQHDGSRVFQQDKDEQKDLQDDKTEALPSSSQVPKAKAKYPHHQVRTSSQVRTLDSLLSQPPNASSDAAPEPGTSRTTPLDLTPSKCSLTSIKNLRDEVEVARHNKLSEIVKEHTFVGVASVAHGTSLIQHGTRLYLVNHAAFAEELFYQRALTQFGDLETFALDPPPTLAELLPLAARGVEQAMVDAAARLLLSKRDLLREYFAIGISGGGALRTLPRLLPGHTPRLAGLPHLLARLATAVVWTEEAACLRGVLEELAAFYALPEDDEARERWTVQHVLWPAAARALVPPRSLLDNAITEVANLPNLYKVFERC